jgi:hypothetical protein
MSHTIFYSWQSDRSTKEGRNLIQKALEIAMQNIAADIQVEDSLRDESAAAPLLQLDRDTKGVPGSPPIFKTILDKIEKASIFVADLTFCGTRCDGNRLTPNPNVLIEYGYALKLVGYGQMIAVMNTTYGKPSRESMPFNLADLRFPLTYELSDNSPDETRRIVREKLAKELERALRDILESKDFTEKRTKDSATNPFPSAAAKNGKARFRPNNEPIGFQRDLMLRRMGTDDASPVHLVQGAAVWLRLMPAKDPGKKWKNLELKQPAMKLVTLPMMQNAGTGIGFLEADDGCGYWMIAQGAETYAVAYVFNTGEVWITNSAMSRSRAADYLELDEEGLASTLDGCAAFLNLIGNKKPYEWLIGFEGIKGRQLIVRNRNLGQCVANLIEAAGSYGENDRAAELLRPFFEDVYDRCGRERPESKPP